MKNLIGFCAAGSGAGKTTLICSQLEELRRRGVKTAVLKHGHHPPYRNHDTGRALAAGAAGALYVSPEGWQLELRPEEELPPEEAAALLRRLTGAELVIVEGWKKGSHPKIALCRRGVSETLPCPQSELLAVITDMPVNTALPCFRPEETGRICDFILE